MEQQRYYGRDLICTQDWERDELEEILRLARKMKEHRYSPKYTELLLHRTFLMFFYNPSVRTRQSFEAAATELGGHAQFLEPGSMRLKSSNTAGETIEDAAKVMSRYAVGIGIRILEDRIAKYGDGDEFLREYASWANIPVLNMADDKFHPFQGLADVMGMRENISEDMRGKTLLQYWGHGALARSWCSVQESLLINSRMGMNIVLAYPDGYDLDPDVIALTKKNCQNNGGSFSISHDPLECYRGADVVYSRNWMSPRAYDNGFDKQKEIKQALTHPEWICDHEKMRHTNNAYFIHPMPVDRKHEVTDEVASGERSLIYDIAENRLHIQKAVMALTMSTEW
ncbi:ornithine carbamoyltransferase [bacterium]|nr:ornithine carbamoyltransferase [bacterium]